MIRRDLQIVRDLAVAVAGGESADTVRATVATLAASSPIWALRVYCLHYCRFVHSHHHYEDMSWFPRLRRANPDLNPVVDRLQQEHKVVASYLDRIEETAAALENDDGARSELVDALNQLAEHLLKHLDYEEASVIPTLRRMSDWRH